MKKVILFFLATIFLTYGSVTNASGQNSLPNYYIQDETPGERFAWLIDILDGTSDERLNGFINYVCEYFFVEMKRYGYHAIYYYSSLYISDVAHFLSSFDAERYIEAYVNVLTQNNYFFLRTVEEGYTVYQLNTPGNNRPRRVSIIEGKTHEFITVQIHISGGMPLP